MKTLFRGVLLVALLASVNAARADWVVQIAAFADSSFLRQMVESIRKAGFPVTTEPLANADGPALTRLLAGPYETNAEAQAAAVQLAAHGWPGYVKQRTDARKSASPPAATKPAATGTSVPAVPVLPKPTPSARPAPSSRTTPSLQPAQPAEPPPTPSPRRAAPGSGTQQGFFQSEGGPTPCAG